MNNVVFADDATQQAATTSFNDLATFLISFFTGPFSKILAAVLLGCAVWNLMHQKIGTVVCCVVAFLILVFLPQILGIFHGGN